MLDRLPLEGDEVVLDAGCGSGRVTEVLVERVPDGRVIAIDGSEEMVSKAREILGSRADIRHGDLEELELEEKVDAIFSNAVFHWIKDHRNLFARLRASLAPGGRLVAQCGGRGNVASLAQVILAVAQERPVRQVPGARCPKAWNFRGDEETAEILDAVGFSDVRCWLEPKEVPAGGAARVPSHRLARPLHEGPAGGAPRPVRRRGPGADGRSARPRLRPAQHRRARDRSDRRVPSHEHPPNA